jgi:hypothetical protein
MKRSIAILIVLAATRAHAADPLPPRQIDPGDAMRAMAEGEARASAPGAAARGALVTGAQFWGQHGAAIIGATTQFISAFRALTDIDATCMDLGDAGAPSVPTSCADSAQCGQCFTDAQRRLDGMRINLERLRCVYTATANFTRASIAFGDSSSGVHGVIGLEWQTQKAGIQQAFESLKHTYDVKYGQMLPNLRASLEGLGECEARYFNEHDWYSRFGFIYYTFMADRYKRSD